MTRSQFHSHDANSRIDIIKAIGIHIGNREYPHHYIRLYQVENFYAEIFFRKKDDTIWKVGGFDHQRLLTPYLDQIDISSLTNFNGR